MKEPAAALGSESNTSSESRPSKESPVYSAPVIHKAFTILEEVAKNQGQLGTSELSRRLKINKSTVYGIIQALLTIGVLRQDTSTKKVRLGPTLIKLGNQAMVSQELRAIASPFIRALSSSIRETVFLGVFDEYGITIIEKADSPKAPNITAPVGSRIPLLAGASGKAFLAYLDYSNQVRLIENRGLPRFTESSITDRKTYLAELEKVKAEGFATDFEEYLRGVHAISVPLQDLGGRLLAVIWIVGFAHSFNKAKMQEAAQAARAAARQIAELL